MTTFYFVGMYHRYRNIPERAFLGVFIGFLFNIFIVNFIKEYNFSRIASFYCWGFNSIFISGWRFAIEEMYTKEAVGGQHRTVVVGSVNDAVKLRNILINNTLSAYEIVGCVETTPETIRGREVDGLHVLGLIDELADVKEVLEKKYFGVWPIYILVGLSLLLGIIPNLGIKLVKPATMLLLSGVAR